MAPLGKSRGPAGDWTSALERAVEARWKHCVWNLMSLTAQECMVRVTFWFDLQEGLLGIGQECRNTSGSPWKNTIHLPARHCNSRKQLPVNQHLLFPRGFKEARRGPHPPPLGWRENPPATHRRFPQGLKGACLVSSPPVRLEK